MSLSLPSLIASVLVPGKETVEKVEGGFPSFPSRAGKDSTQLGYKARRVGEFKESEDWSPLLLLLRWALEHDSEGDTGDSCSNTFG